MEINLNKMQTIAVFITLFLLIGYLTPIVFVSLSSEEQFVEVHNFQASDTHVNAETHNICFNRTVHRPSDVDITVEMILVRENVTIESSSFEIDAYYQKGLEEVIISRQLSENMEVGTYRYIHNVELSYFNGQAEKNLKFKSGEFDVHQNSSDIDNDSGIISC